jgi:YceI-like domain/tRNA_anti-like
MKKTIFVLAIIGSITALVAWYFIFYKPTHLRRSAANEKAIVVNANTLVQQFISNENQANTTFLNKAIETSGNITAINTIENNQIISIQTNTGNISIQLKETTPVKIGNTVTVKGFVAGFIDNQVQLIEGIITQNNNKIISTNIAIEKDTTKPIVKKDTVAEKIYKTNTATIQFFSKAPAENIEAINKQVIASINTTTGNIIFTALIKGFRFENELMQEHFNGADYMNSNQFPKAIFKGTIQNKSNIPFNINGKYKAIVKGNLTIHGITKQVTTNAEITIKNGKLITTTNFLITFKDYNVSSWDDAATTAQITIQASF